MILLLADENCHCGCHGKLVLFFMLLACVSDLFRYVLELAEDLHLDWSWCAPQSAHVAKSTVLL